MDDIVENSFIMQHREKDVTNVVLPAVLEDRLDYLEQQLRQTSKAIGWIVDTLASSGAGAKTARPVLKSVEDIRQEG